MRSISVAHARLKFVLYNSVGTLLTIARRAMRIAVLFAMLPASAAAQTAATPAGPSAEPAAAYKEGKLLRAFRITGPPPSIDGRLDDEAWVLAESAGQFVQWDPDNMEPMSESTRIQVAYDARYLYVAIRCDDRTPDAIASGLGRRDEFPPTDTVAIGFDPRHDHQTGYTFMTNPSGVQSDMSFFNDDNTDRDFDAVWEVQTAITSEGWVAEYRIPFSQMRFTASPAAGQIWGFSGRRTIRRRSETGEWTAKPRGERGTVSRWGHLVFGEPLEPPRRVEWQPYALIGTIDRSSTGADLTGSAGLDLRVGLGSAATLAVTVNPDFGQVEQDPAVLNLSVFETFFPEKRPFFLEDSRTFLPPYGLFQLFHSRRIGKHPDRFEPESDDDIRDRPDQTTILGAVKLTGKGGGWTYGGLTALTSREYATIQTGAGDAPEERLLEPMTSYSVVRVQRDMRGGTSNVGAIATGAVRENDLDAFTGGFDYHLRWDRNRVVWNGHWAVTQAPVDGVMRTGAGGVTNFNFSRKHWFSFWHFDHFDREFRVDDLGFFRSRANRTSFDGGFGIEQPDPWKGFRRLGANAFVGQAWNDEQLVFWRAVGTNMWAELRNFWVIEGGFARDFQVFDDLDTRGGPAIVLPAKVSSYFGLGTDSRKTWRLFFGANGHRNGAGGWSTRVGPDLRLQPSTRLQTSIRADYTFARDIAQWIENSDTNADGVTDHLYGTLHRDVVDVSVRSTYAIHRDLTVQAFLQPFVAVGDYRNIRRLARPRSFDFEPAALATDPDFNRKSLRGNVVLRWEYVRGSTLFVAWNLATSDTSRPGVFSPFRDLGGAFGADGRHTFLVKITHWLSR